MGATTPMPGGMPTLPERPEWAPRISFEKKRGCGWRKEGGLYAIGTEHMGACGRLPLPLVVCPTCRGGIKPSRSWTWINPAKLAAEASRCTPPADPGCPKCPLGDLSGIERAGLIWVGESYYASPEAFMREARTVGISRRIPTLPRGLAPGETWCFLAHRKVFPGAEPVPCPSCFNGFPVEFRKAPCCGRARTAEPVAGLFAAFVVRRVERIVPEAVSQEECEALRARGIDPVIVRKVIEAAAASREAAEAEMPF